jgi:hypothetical protein
LTILYPFILSFSMDFTQKLEIDTSAIFLEPTPMIETAKEALTEHKDLEKRKKKDGSICLTVTIFYSAIETLHLLRLGWN